MGSCIQTEADLEALSKNVVSGLSFFVYVIGHQQCMLKAPYCRY